MLQRGRASRSRHDRRVGLVVAAGLGAFVVGVYVVVVLGGGLLIGQTDSPSIALSVLATAIVAYGFLPVQLRWERAAARFVHGATPSAYDVLSHFSETVTGGYATEDLPERMALLLGQGTGAAWAQVWLTVDGRLRLAATWPDGAVTDLTPPDPGQDGTEMPGPGARARTVRHAGQVYGVFRLQEHPDRPLTSTEERLFAGLAAQAGLVLRQVGLRAQLAARGEQLAARAEQLRTSRERLIETQDAERRRLERDIHDGAQQHLVALAVNLRLAETIAAKAPERAAKVLSEQAAAAQAAIETLSQLSRGIYPRLLEDDGLVPALRAATATSAIPVTISVNSDDRPPEAVEAALYFFAMEAVQNAAKHSGAAGTSVAVLVRDDEWQVTVRDDGAGFDPVVTGGTGSSSGLLNMRDRLDDVGGDVAIASTIGRGTTVTATVPCCAIPRPRRGR